MCLFVYKHVEFFVVSYCTGCIRYGVVENANRNGTELGNLNVCQGKDISILLAIELCSKFYT